MYPPTHLCRPGAGHSGNQCWHSLSPQQSVTLKIALEVPTLTPAPTSSLWTPESSCQRVGEEPPHIIGSPPDRKIPVCRLTGTVMQRASFMQHAATGRSLAHLSSHERGSAPLGWRTGGEGCTASRGPPVYGQGAQGLSISPEGGTEPKLAPQVAGNSNCGNTDNRYSDSSNLRVKSFKS